MPALDNARHEAFARAMVEGKSAVAAYVAAGYRKTSADANATRLMENDGVSIRIAELKAEAAKGSVLTAQQVLEGLSRLAGSNMADYVGAHGQFLDVAQLTRDQAAAVQEVTIETRTQDDTLVTRTKLKLYDKRAALTDLGRHYGLFKDKLDVEATVDWKQLVVRSFGGKSE